MTAANLSDRLRVLVTGFGSFPGVRDNPSERLVRWLRDDDRWAIRPDIDLHTEILTVAWQSLPAAIDALVSDVDPQIAIHFGVHSRAPGFTIEDCARNRTARLVDVDGCEWERHEIVADAPRMIKAPSPARKLATYLTAAGLPAAPSSDAGAYLCNMLFYLSLERQRRTGQPAIVHFIHIPPLAEHAARNTKHAMSRDMLRAGVAAIIRYNIANYRKSASTRRAVA